MLILRSILRAADMHLEEPADAPDLHRLEEVQDDAGRDR